MYIGLKNILLNDTTENTIDMLACYKLSGALNKLKKKLTSNLIVTVINLFTPRNVF